MKLETVPPRIRALHTLTLLAFALSQPLLDLLALHTTFLVAHRIEDERLVALAFAIAVGVPGLLCGAKWTVEHALSAFGSLIGAKLGWALHLSILAALVAALALPALKSLPATFGAVLVGASGVLGLVAAFCYARWRPARALLTVLAPAPILFAAVFLANPEVRKLRAGTDAAREVGAATQGEAPVVFMLFDALGLDSLLDESGGIDARRHPHLAAFAKRATWFRNATTVAEMTDYAVPAILTGDYPATRRPPTAAEYPQNLFTVLADRYALDVQEGPTRLCPESLCRDVEPPGVAAQFYRVGSDLLYIYLHMLLPEDWSEELPSVTSGWSDFASGSGFRSRPGLLKRSERARGDTSEAHRRWADIPWVFDRFLESIRRSRGPTLHFVHLNLPHPPYKYLPSGLEYGPIGSPANFNDAFGRNWREDEWAVTQGLQRHLLQVAYADVLVGRMLDTLEEIGRFDEALIVIAADHGISYRRGMNRRLLSDGGENAADILRVPLFVKVPGQRVGEVSERNAETIDVLPTIVDALGGSLVESVDGVSLIDPGAPPRLRKTVYLWRAARTNELPRRSFPAVIDGDAGRRRIRERFDTQRGIPGLFSVGRHAGLIGRAAPLGENRSGDAEPRYSVRLADRDSYDTVDPLSGFVPAQVTGEISGGAGRLDLAVAVGGTIRAVTRTLAERSKRFSAMVPADSFQRGRNHIRIYVIEETGGDVVLVPTRDAAVRVAYAIDRAPDGTVRAIVSSAGERYPFYDRLRGEVTRSTYSFSGRVTDARTLRTVDVVLLFAQGVYLYAHDVEPRGSANPSPHDFEFLVPYARLRNVRDNEISFYALAAGAASELGYDSGSTAARSVVTGVREP